MWLRGIWLTANVRMERTQAMGAIGPTRETE